VVTLPNYMKLILNFRLLINFYRPIPLCVAFLLKQRLDNFFPKDEKLRRPFLARRSPLNGVTTMVNTHMNTDLDFTNYVKLVGVFAEEKKTMV
jgi:hypothetical protein